MLNLSDDMCEALEANYGYVPIARLQNELRSETALEKLRQSFIARGNPKPKMYGNLYVDDEGILVVNVVDDDAQLKKEIAEALKGEQYYTKSVTYPWAYLESLRDAMLSQHARTQNKKIMDNFVALYAEETSNLVVVELLDVGEGAIAEYKKHIMDSPVLVFRKAPGKIEPCINVNSGQRIDYYTGAYGSLAYRATTNSTSNYVVSSGHLFTASNTGATAWINGTNVGYCTNRYAASTNIDAALVAITNSNYMASNTLHYTSGYSLGTLITAATSGLTYYKQGVTTGTTSGTCDATSISIPINGGTTTDQIRVVASSGAMAQHGDSGGILYSTSRTTVGETVAMSGTSTAYFSKASNINSKFGITRY